MCVFSRLLASRYYFLHLMPEQFFFTHFTSYLLTDSASPFLFIQLLITQFESIQSELHSHELNTRVSDPSSGPIQVCMAVLRVYQKQNLRVLNVCVTELKITLL